jgi:hypothetical protein
MGKVRGKDEREGSGKREGRRNEREGDGKMVRRREERNKLN